LPKSELNKNIKKLDMNMTVMGPGQKFLTLGLVNFLRLGSDQGSHLWFGFGKFPLKTSNFSSFSSLGQKISSGRVKKSRVKGVSASYLLQAKSNLGSGRVRAHL